MNTPRITSAFAKAESEKRGAFVAYLTIGFPSLDESEKAIDSVIASGADIVELGVPFSDPFADGGVIRSAAYEALRQGVTIDHVIALAKRVRERHPETGLVLFSYYNLIFSKGLEKFAAEVADAGIDAVLAVDLPLEEREELLQVLRPHGIGYIPLIAPNTPLERVKESEAGRAISPGASTRYAPSRIFLWRQDSASRRRRRPMRCAAMPTDSSWDPLS